MCEVVADRLLDKKRVRVATTEELPRAIAPRLAQRRIVRDARHQLRRKAHAQPHGGQLCPAAGVRLPAGSAQRTGS